MEIWEFTPHLILSHQNKTDDGKLFSKVLVGFVSLEYQDKNKLNSDSMFQFWVDYYVVLQQHPANNICLGTRK